MKLRLLLCLLIGFAAAQAPDSQTLANTWIKGFFRQDSTILYLNYIGQKELMAFDEASRHTRMLPIPPAQEYPAIIEGMLQDMRQKTAESWATAMRYMADHGEITLDKYLIENLMVVDEPRGKAKNKRGEVFYLYTTKITLFAKDPTQARLNISLNTLKLPDGHWYWAGGFQLPDSWQTAK